MGKILFTKAQQTFVDENYLEYTQRELAEKTDSKIHRIAYYMKIKGYKIPEEILSQRCREMYYKALNPKFRKYKARDSKTYDQLYEFARKLGFENTTSAIGEYGARPFKKKFKEYQEQN